VLQVWNVANPKRSDYNRAEPDLEILGVAGSVTSVDATVDCRTIVAGLYGGGVVVLDLETHEVRSCIPNQKAPIEAVAISSGGGRLAYVTRDGRVGTTELANGNHRILPSDGQNSEPLWRPDYGAKKSSVEFSADGRILIACVYNMVRAWDLENDKVIATFTMAYPTASAISSGGFLIAAGEPSGEVHFLRPYGSID
jgi:WD40 repeat protein